MCRDVTKSGNVMWRRDKTKSKVCFQVEWKLWGSDEEMYSFFFFKWFPGRRTSSVCIVLG